MQLTLNSGHLYITPGMEFGVKALIHTFQHLCLLKNVTGNRFMKASSHWLHIALNIKIPELSLLQGQV